MDLSSLMYKTGIIDLIKFSKTEDVIIFKDNHINLT